MCSCTATIRADYTVAWNLGSDSSGATELLESPQSQQWIVSATTPSKYSLLRLKEKFVL